MDIMCICTINVVQGRLGKNVVKSPLTPCLNSATMIDVPYKGGGGRERDNGNLMQAALPEHLSDPLFVRPPIVNKRSLKTLCRPA
jgi:hypothetical protein